MARPETRPTVVVTGATGIVARYLLPRLVAAGHEVLALSRRPAPPWVPVGLRWQVADVAQSFPLAEGISSAALIHVAPVWLAPGVVSALVPFGLRRVVAFGSTSRFSKAASRDTGERALAHRLADAEAALERACVAAAIPWTILRPTLIYGGGFDRNVSLIAAFIRRFGFFPLVAGGRGGRQPVHADDLALAALAALDHEGAKGRSYDLSGGTTLSYREMVVAIFAGLSRRPRFVEVPLALARLALRLARLAPGLGHLTPSVADRMAADLCFDHAAAARDLGYAPRPFVFPGAEPPPARIRGR